REETGDQLGVGDRADKEQPEDKQAPEPCRPRAHPTHGGLVPAATEPYTVGRGPPDPVAAPHALRRTTGVASPPRRLYIVQRYVFGPTAPRASSDRARRRLRRHAIVSTIELAFGMRYGGDADHTQ